MIDRVTKNLKTTIAGSILFVTGIALVAFEKATLIEAGTFFGVAFVLFFSKDGEWIWRFHWWVDQSGSTKLQHW